MPVNLYNSLKQGRTDYSAVIEEIIENQPVPISVVDLDERFTLFNRSYEIVFNIKREQLLGKHYSIHVGLDEKSIHKVVLSTQQYYSGTKIMGRNERLVQVEGFPVFIDGRMVCSVAVIHEFSSVERQMSALNDAHLNLREATLQKAKYSFEDIVHASGSIEQLIARAKTAASTHVTVLLRGESGTGKELFAHAIHRASARSGKKFVSVNCTSIPESLLESVLFGYAGQAFTGAKKEGSTGLFEAADGGTIFLDEIGDISPSLQMTLLRVLQEKEVTRIGETKPRTIDVRIITATNADLEAKVSAGAFRLDLYYRLNVFPIHIPPLRERPEDIVSLTEHFLRRYSMEFGRHVSAIDPECWPLLTCHDWPGNVRELENTVMRSVVNASPEADAIRKGDVQLLENPQPGRPQNRIRLAENGRYRELFAAWEANLFRDAYLLEEKNKTRLAKRLDLSVRTVYQKLKEYGIETR